MSPVTAIDRPIDSRLGQRQSGSPAAEPGKPAEQSRALVPLSPLRPVAGGGNPLQRPSAAFLTQLIAAKRNLPQARERRRAEPHEAIAAYAAVARAA